MAGCCAYGDKSSVYIKFREFLYQVISFSRRIFCRGDGYLMIFGEISVLKQRSWNCEILKGGLLFAGCMESNVPSPILAILFPCA